MLAARVIAKAATEIAAPIESSHQTVKCRTFFRIFGTSPDHDVSLIQELTPARKRIVFDPKPPRLFGVFAGVVDADARSDGDLGVGK